MLTSDADAVNRYIELAAALMLGLQRLPSGKRLAAGTLVRSFFRVCALDGVDRLARLSHVDLANGLLTSCLRLCSLRLNRRWQY